MKHRSKRAGRSKQAGRGMRHWVTAGKMGALVVCTAVGTTIIPPALTRQSGVGAVYAATYAATQEPTRRFEIPSGSLGEALDAFEAATGWKFVLTDKGIRDLSSPGVSGSLTDEAALRQLLTGTGVIYRNSGPRAAILELRGPSDSVSVTAPELSSPKYSAPLRDIPQTIHVIPRVVIEEQGATTLRDVLRNVPGITLTAGEGGAAPGDNLTLRGFSARNDIFIDGVRDLGPQSRDPFNLEQVEVVKGPGSAYAGRGSAGGTINLVSKSPSLTRFIGATLNLGTDETRRVSADLNLPFADRSALRLNLLAHESGVAGRDVVRSRRWGIAPSLALGLGTRSRFTLNLFHLQQDNISDYGIPWVPATNNALKEYRDRPAPVPRDTFYGLRSRDAEEMLSDFATLVYENDLNDSTVLRSQFRYGLSTRDSIATPPRFASNDSTVINREMRSWLTRDDIYDSQTDLRAGFSTGAVTHNLVAGLSFTRETNERRTRTAPNMPTTLLNPNPNDVFTGAIVEGANVGDVTGNSAAVYAFDTARLGKHWELTGGLRYDYFDAEGVTTTPSPVSRIDRMLSWRGGVVFKPTAAGSVYVSYGTSLSPSLEGLSYGTANTAIEPEKTYTFEVGSKWDLFRDRLLLSGAVFRVEKTNARTPGIIPGDPPQVLDGEQRVRGVELGISGSITSNWRVMGAYTYLNSEIVKSNTPAEVGKELQNTPENSYSIWSTYQTPWKLSFGGGPRFVGSRFGNNTNTRQVDNYWLLDAMASYPLSDHIELRLNMFNLTDSYYFDRLGGGHLIPGAGRSVMFSTSFRF